MTNADAEKICAEYTGLALMVDLINTETGSMYLQATAIPMMGYEPQKNAIPVMFQLDPLAFPKMPEDALRHIIPDLMVAAVKEFSKRRLTKKQVIIT